MFFYVVFPLYLLISTVTSQSREYKDTGEYNGNSTQVCEKQFSCKNCTTVRICKKNYYGHLSKILEVQCEGETPYCDQESGTCVKTTDLNECNRSTASDFTCSSDGHYPHPSNCYKYFVCTKGNAFKMDCGNAYYNPKSQNCDNQYYCNTISCSQKSGIKVGLKSDSSFYGYCYKNTLIVFEKCPGKFEFDNDKQNCVPVCKSEGLQGDPFDCKKYYQCSYFYVSTKYTYEFRLNHLNCYDEQYFDSVNLRCAPLLKGLQCESGLVHIGNGTFIHKNELH